MTVDFGEVRICCRFVWQFSAIKAVLYFWLGSIALGNHAHYGWNGTFDPGPLILNHD